MNRCTNHHEKTHFAAWARRAATVAAVLAGGLGVALAAFAAPAPLPTPPPALATPYSWPNFHAGGVPSTPPNPLSTPYDQLQGTPTGLYGPSGSQTLEQIPSLILGNTGAGVPTPPPGSGGTNGYVGGNLAPFLNHFFNGPNFGPHYFQIAGPLGFTLPASGIPTLKASVQSSPTVVNATQYQEIAYMYYDGVAASPQNPLGNATLDAAPDPTPSGTPPPVLGGSAPLVPASVNNTHAIRQVVYFGRNESLPVVKDPVSGQNTLGGVRVPATLPEGTNVTVGAIYAMDGFTGGVIWRYQTPSFGANSVAVTNGFSATISGTAHSATTAGPQPFQVGPTAFDSTGTTVVDSAPSPPLAGAATFPAGNFTAYTPTGSLPVLTSNPQFSLYAKTATVGTNNNVVYTGDWRIFKNGTNANDNSATTTDLLASGTFTVTAIFDLVTDPTGHFANVTGTFNADATTSPSFAAGFPAAFNGTFDARSGQQIISGSLQTIPGGAILRDAAVLSSVSVARVNVTVPSGYPGGPGVASKLVVIAADNNGYVYCLDALGNGYQDPAAEANGNVLYQNTNPTGANYTTDPAIIGQVHFTPTTSETYGAFPKPPDLRPHVGTTFPYWIYRPDPAQPKYASGTKLGQVKTFDPTSDLPVPQAFNNASPILHVNFSDTNNLYNSGDLGSLRPGYGPNTVLTGGTGGHTVGGGALTTDGTVYAGNSNGVLYALDCLGLTGPNANTFNNSVTGNPGIDDGTTPTNTPGTPQTLWWFTAPGATPAAGTDNPVSIQSAPAVLTTDPSYPGDPTVYVATSNPAGGSSNAGRLYAIDGVVGPTGNGGNGSATPGSAGYNINPKGRWAFPNAYGTTTYAPLGNITGSPVVFNNTDDTSGGTNGTTYIYFAANTGQETVQTAGGTSPVTQSFPPSDNTGRIWSVDTKGKFGFAYPGATSTTAGAGDPNKATLDAMNPPIGGFLHTTPAIGFVTFPASIYYLAAGGAQTPYTITDSQGATTFNGAANRTVPMLYAGTSSTSGVTGAELEYVDLDGTSDAQRGLYAQPAPNGASFQSSPILVANTSATGTPGGNGGSVFITTSDNHLLQYQATPITTANTSAPYPSPRLDYTFPGGDAVSAPAVGSASVSDFTGTTVTDPNTGTMTTVSESVTDWVYVGDSTTGFCFGFTPRGAGGTDTTGNFLPTILPPQDPSLPSPVINQFPLRAYLYDGSTAHPATVPGTLDMNKANPYGQASSTLPIFEWGQPVYFRIANVVPPAPVGDTFSPTSAYAMLDPTSVNDTKGPSYFYNANGGIAGGVTFQTTEVDNSGTAIANTTDSFYVPPVLTTDPSVANGFYERTDTGTTATLFGSTSELDGTGQPRAKETMLLDANGKGYAAAVAYNVGFNGALDASGQSRHNTPGVRRKLISVIQSVTRYAPNGSGGYTQQVVQLHLVNDPNFTYQTNTQDTNGGYTDQTTASLYVDEPTFGILNPLAVRGAGVSLTGGLGRQATWLDSNGEEGAGPFQGVDPVDLATAGAARTTAMEALANGNSVLTNPPPSGVLVTNPDPSHPSATSLTNATTYQPYYRYVITASTGQIPHGTDGDNTDPNPNTIGQGSRSSVLPPGDKYGQYLLNIADRSMLGNVNGVLNITMQRAPLDWNDNTGSGGPGARINPLSWDDYPLVRQNSSLDYPNVGANNLTEYLDGSISLPLITPNKQVLSPATGAGSGRTVNPLPVLTSIHIPKYQSANLQLWGRSGVGGGPLPSPSSYSPTVPNFPDGYVALQRVAASSNPFATPNVGSQTADAYRDVYVYTGVPVDMSTSIGNPVVDVGTVPHGFGVQMDAYLAVNTYTPSGFTPYTANVTISPPAGPVPFPGFQGHFVPLTIYNNGNTNLINPHLDQKINEPKAPTTLPLLSDALDSDLSDPLSYIPAFDFNNARTGSESYLLRSSFDTDLANAFGINPGVKAAGNSSSYPVLTFHKPRVSDGANLSFPGTVMTVPDVPHDNYQGTPYYLESTSGQTVVNNNEIMAVDPNTQLLVPATSKPRVSVAVPLGTPVGTYSQVVRMFEGYDVPYDPLVGPRYNGNGGGYGTFDPTTLDTFRLALNGSGVPQAEQAYSDPGTLVKVSVEESRLTDGFTPGALPQIDLTPQGATNTGSADFSPAAFRDPVTGAMTLFWTTSRHYKVASDPLTGSLYTIAGANLSFNNTSGNTFFVPNTAGSAPQWWAPLTTSGASPQPFGTLLPAGNHVGWSVAPDQRYALNGTLNTSDKTAYGFDTDVLGTGPGALTNLYCYQVAPASGALIGTAVSVANSTQPKSGAHGLKFTGISFADPNGGMAIGNNLWAFWAGGTRGRTSLNYSSTTTGTSSGALGTFAGPAGLPVPASLTALANPSPVLTYAPDPAAPADGNASGTAIPVIEVTYAGTNPAGQSDLYLSRYRPYHPVTNGAADPTVTLLAAVPFARLTEQLQPQPGGNWWQARDVGWLRNGKLNVSIGGTALFTTQTPTYDQASGLLVYNGITLGGVTGQTVFVDVAGGRVRFSRPLAAKSAVVATFNPTARRITTDSVANFAPSVFLDEAFQPNASGVGPNVIVDRYWFLWQKAGIPGTTSVPPTLWYKPQRLTVALTDSSGNPLPIKVTGGQPQVTVKLGGTTLYTPTGGGVVDVDAARGRLYFPVTNSGIALEGQTVTVNGTDAAGNAIQASDIVHWVDEPRFNDSSNQVTASDTTPGAFAQAGVPDGYLVPFNTTKNEGGVAAFLDPQAYVNTGSSIVAPHDVWLFWNSTRNGTSDVFYETINPRFSSVTPASGAP